VRLRTARADDDADLIRLAALDCARPLAGPAIVAEGNGGVVAALRGRPPMRRLALRGAER
jgi:small ligand-binding sensory domain FIST